jgi:hypothetical protein
MAFDIASVYSHLIHSPTLVPRSTPDRRNKLTVSLGLFAAGGHNDLDLKASECFVCALSVPIFSHHPKSRFVQLRHVTFFVYSRGARTVRESASKCIFRQLFVSAFEPDSS